jgi:hypothetical protein
MRIEPDFDAGTGTVLLRLAKQDVGLPAHCIEYLGRTFRPKDELHITIVGSKLGKELLACIDDDPPAREAIREAVAATPWRCILRDEWFHVVREPAADRPEKPEAESIVRMVDVAGLDAFYEVLGRLCVIDICPRPTHITLFTWNDDEGIGISTWEEFHSLVIGSVSPADWETVT